MSPEAQWIAIAEVCGWTEVTPSKIWPGRIIGSGPRGGIRSDIPDYLTDLNAMHAAVDAVLIEAGRKGDWRGWDSYVVNLTEMVGGEGAIEATASQRAEAFLRTLGKWVD